MMASPVAEETFQLELMLTAASLAAMRADPDAAEAGLAAGLAASLGVDSDAVTITRTVPSLRARALAARRLQDTSLLVEFTVAGASAAAIETAVAAVDSSTLAAELTTELAARGITV